MSLELHTAIQTLQWLSLALAKEGMKISNVYFYVYLFLLCSGSFFHSEYFLISFKIKNKCLNILSTKVCVTSWVLLGTFPHRYLIYSFDPHPW